MTWFRIDDVLTFHPRVIRAGNAAMGLWLRAGTWCAEHLTDGWIAHEDARALGSASEIKRLVAVGLWVEEERADERGYQFHRWAANGVGDRRQPTRAEVEERRRLDRERKSKGGRTTAGIRAASGRNPDGVRVESDRLPPAPVPSRPVPDSPDGLSPADKPPTVIVTKGEFARWWDTYPRHQAREAAAKAYKAARQRGATADELFAGAERYRDDPNREAAYTAHPATWLNRGSWTDDPLPKKSETSKPTPVAPPLRSFN